jgi:hypothetical protein
MLTVFYIGTTLSGFISLIYLLLNSGSADSASNTLSVLLKLVSNDNNILIPAISMEKSPYMIE